jgi:hypothetical protein
LNIGIWDLFGIWCLRFEISKCLTIWRIDEFSNRQITTDY